MRVLVTGSEGFIGKNLVAALKTEGHEVVGYDLKVGKNFAQSQELWSDCFDVIYHLACVNQMAAVDNPINNLLWNTEGTREMAKMAMIQGAKLVYTSTASVYGNAEQIPTPVTAKLNPLTDYAVAKLAGEFFVQNSGADWTILRLSNVYGPHQTLENPYCGVIGRFFEDSIAGKPMQVIGDGQQTRDFSYVADVVDFIRYAGIKKLNGKILNVSSGVETSIEELATEISLITNHPLHLDNQDYVYGVSPRVIDSIKRRVLVPDLVCSTSLTEGLEKTYSWFTSM